MGYYLKKALIHKKYAQPSVKSVQSVGEFQHMSHIRFLDENFENILEHIRFKNQRFLLIALF